MRSSYHTKPNQPWCGVVVPLGVRGGVASWAREEGNRDSSIDSTEMLPLSMSVRTNPPRGVWQVCRGRQVASRRRRPSRVGVGSAHCQVSAALRG